MAERLRMAIAKARARRATVLSRIAVPGPVARTEADPTALVHAWASLPEVAPTTRRLEAGRVFTRSGHQSGAAFDGLRLRLMQELRARRWRRVAITAPRDGCGRSTLAANLAFSIARQHDQRAVLMELDMRAPTLAETLGLRGAPQFAQVLKGRSELPSQLVRAGSNLCLALNGTPVPDAAETLLDPRVPAVLDALEALLAPTVMLFDLPPMMTSPEVSEFLRLADCALLVVAADETQMDEADGCAQEMARHTHALGVVLNKLRGS